MTKMAAMRIYGKTILMNLFLQNRPVCIIFLLQNQIRILHFRICVIKKKKKMVSQYCSALV